MTKNRIAIWTLFLCLFMTTNPSFAVQTNAEEDETNRPDSDAEEAEECGFFCAIGEFFEGLLD